MEFRDSGPEITAGEGLFKSRFTVIVAVLVGVAVIGLCVLGLFLTGLFPPGRRTAATTGQATATRLTFAVATETSAPSGLSGTTNASPTPTDTPVDIPTAVPLPPPATATNTSTARTPAARVPPSSSVAGLYVTRLRVDPSHPVKNDPINFYITFVNPTGKPENHNICVEIYRPGEKKSFGITHCPSQTIPTGTSEIMTGGWIVTGIRQCIPVRARPISRDDGDNRFPYLQANGNDLWLDFQVCP